MSTYDNILKLADTLIQQRGFNGFSYADLEAGLGIRKASIHHHFKSKTDLGLAYCEYKIEVFNELKRSLQNIPPGLQRVAGYLSAFSDCADKGEMCGVYAMLSDSHQLPDDLQSAVSKLVKVELSMLAEIIAAAQENGEVTSSVAAEELATVVCSALKGALMLNRIAPHEAYENSLRTLQVMLKA